MEDIHTIKVQRRVCAASSLSEGPHWETLYHPGLSLEAWGGCDAELIQHLWDPLLFSPAPHIRSSVLDLPALQRLHSRLRCVDKSVCGNWNTAGGAIKAHAHVWRLPRP